MTAERVAMLFTDIEGSTRLLDRLGERYEELLAEHNRLMREAIGAAGGREIHTAGDSFFSVFPRVYDAAKCAVAVQLALAAGRWPDGNEPRVRLGIHVGAPTAVDDDFVGMDVHRAARAMAVAYGGQVILTGPAREALGGSSEVRDLGHHRLKDLPAPEHLFQLIAPGLETDFPPLRSLNRSNLPTPVNPLIGRSAEVSAALRQLSRREVRLLTLLGPGGAGKTRLAIDVAGEAAPRYRDGVWLVLLAPLLDPRLMVSEIARVLEIDAVPGEPLEQALTTALADRELLLVLDNFEHLLDGAGLVSELLVAAPGLDVLATSREPLRITGEHRLDVPPLAPDDAGKLFIQRALAVRGDLVLDEADTRAIERICARLDGLPLALELAAARTSIFAPRALEARLAEGLPLPAGPRDLPERQRTLHATIDWSYRLLERGEQELLASLAPFVGGVRLDSAESIWGTSATDSLISLAEKSLLRRREDPDAEPRFWMLETVREFALELAVGDESAGAADAHAEYFAALAGQAAPHLHGREQVRWLDLLESDYSNVRAALDHLILREPAQALSMASDLAWFWHTRGYETEALRRLTEVLASAPRDSPGRGRALIGAGRIAASLGDLEEAKSLSLNALSVARRENEPRVAVLALANLGWMAAMMGDDAGMAAGYEEAIATARTAGDDWALGLALNGYSSCPAVRADAERARPMVEEALTLFRRTDDPAGIAVTAGTFAEIATDAGDLELAEPLIEESLALAREIEYRLSIAAGLVDRSVISLLRGDVDGADRDVRAALETSSQGNLHVTAETLAAAATIAAIRREPDRAAMLWAACDRVGAEASSARSALARLREQWEPHALADAGAASWEAARKAGALMDVEDALVLAAGGPASVEPSPRTSDMVTAH